jgi:hypothetical protein
MTSNVDDTDLVKQLFRLQKKSPKLCKSTLYDAPEQPGIKVRSWKMAEHHYYTVPSPFPTYARGIFTSRITGKDEDGGDERAQYRIVARGYDKFFNMGEVPWSTVGSRFALFFTCLIEIHHSGMPSPSTPNPLTRSPSSRTAASSSSPPSLPTNS